MEQLLEILDNLMVMKIENNRFDNEQELMTYQAGLEFAERYFQLSSRQIQKHIEDEYESPKGETRNK